MQNTSDPLLELGLEGCRLGDWDIGLPALLSAITRAPKDAPLPSLVYSYVGCGLAMVEGQIGGGVEACEWAAQSPSQRTPEHLVNLVRALMAGERRGRALEVIEVGLSEHPNHPELATLRSSLGQRRPPVIAGLARANFLNRSLGRFRQQFEDRTSSNFSPALEAVLSKALKVDYGAPDQAPVSPDSKPSAKINVADEGIRK